MGNEPWEDLGRGQINKNYKCKDAMAGPSMGKEEKAGQCDQTLKEAGNKGRHDGRGGFMGHIISVWDSLTLPL